MSILELLIERKPHINQSKLIPFRKPSGVRIRGVRKKVEAFDLIRAAPVRRAGDQLLG
jgi:hypothetical protein